MEHAERRSVHFVGEDGQFMAHVLDLVNVVIAACRAFGELKTA